jgi:thiol-disulfide isomerase/thioredoxin
MKRLLLLFLVVAGTVYAVPQSGRRVNTTRTAPVQPPLNPAPEVPSPKPPAAVLTFLTDRVLDRRIRTLDNKSFHLGDFQGKVLVINLWASWCGPCRKEIPEYESVRNDYLGRDVKFIGLTMEDPARSEARVNRFVRETNFGFLLGWADDELAETLMNGRREIPQTLVIATNQSVVNHWTGYERGHSGNRLRAAIENALK